MSVASRLWALRRERPAFVALAALTLAFFLAWPLVDWQLRIAGIAPEFRFWDFGAYGGAVERWRAGEPLYVPNEDGGYHGAYLYPPVATLLFAPFLVLPTGVAAPTWALFTLACLWVGLQLVVAACGLDLRGGERLVLLWAALGFQPVLIGLKLGQTAGFLTGLLCLAFAANAWIDRFRGPWRAVSGVTTAFVGVVKLPYASAGAHLLRDRHRLGWAVVAGVTLMGLSFALFGIETHRTYLAVLRWGIEAGSEARSPRLWLPTYYRPLYHVPGSTLLRVLGALVIAALALFANGSAERETFAAGVAAVPLLAPKTYTYYLVATLPAVVVLLAVEFDRDGRPALPVLAALLMNVHAYGLRTIAASLPQWIPPSPAFAPVLALVQPGLWGNLLLVGLATFRLAERVERPVVPSRWMAPFARSPRR